MSKKKTSPKTGSKKKFIDNTPEPDDIDLVNADKEDDDLIKYEEDDSKEATD